VKTAFGIVLAIAAIGLPGANARAQSSGASSAQHHQGVNERGDHVMGFDHEKTTHHFLLTESGGEIVVSANDPADTASRDAIRMHLSHVAGMFKEGNFEAPMLIHDRIPPGVPVMKSKKALIQWIYQDTKSGGRILIATKDPEALSAIHEFLRFQIEDHRTGDPLEVGKKPGGAN
jgi:hypothetical protein